MKKLLLLLLFVCPQVFADLYYETYRGTGAYPNMPYYGTGQLTYPTVLSSGTVTAINHDWGGGAVLNSGRSEQVLVKYWGYIYVPGSGSQTLTFYNSSDDGFYLRLNNQVVINDWQEQGTAYYNGAGSITLTGGQYYYLEAWYYENGGGAVSRLYWNQTGSVEIVPTSSYYLTEPVPTTTTTTGTSTGPTSTQAATKSAAGIRRDSYFDNGIYIDQVGSNNTINILQESENNQIRGINQQRAKMWGNYNTYDIRQGGVNTVGINLIEMMVDGNSNNVTILQDRYDNGTADDSASGDHIIRLMVDGNSNTVYTLQRSQANQSGHFGDIAVTGDSNNISLIQKSESEQTAFIDVTGSSNLINLNQLNTLGNGQHFADIKLTGDGHSVNLTQNGTGAHRATINLTNGSAPSTLDLNQFGSTNQSFSLEQSCYTVGGCSTTLTQQ